jgi:hypothetical protein
MSNAKSGTYESGVFTNVGWLSKFQVWARLGKEYLLDIPFYRTVLEPGTCELGTELVTWNLRTCERFNNPPSNLKSDSSAKKILRKMGVQDFYLIMSK